MLLSTLALVCLPAVQEPSAALQRSLASDDAAVRFAAAREVAVGDGQTEKWLLREAAKGRVQRQRALLLAAALMGTSASHGIVEEAARKGRKPDPQRAFALLLYGSFHPDAGLSPAEDWDRCGSEFERGCLLAGLLSRSERLPAEPWEDLVAKRKQPALVALLQMAQRLAGHRPPDSSDPPSHAASLLAAMDPRRPPVPKAMVARSGTFPGLWRIAARRKPARSLDELRKQALVGDRVGLVLALYEVDPGDRQALFDHFRTRVVGPQESAWLWGAAGDLGLKIPGPEDGHLRGWHVAGILRLGRKDLAAARIAAQGYLGLARKSFRASTPFASRWPAAILLAFGGQAEDLDLLKKAFEDATGSERHRLAPIWKFANRSFGSGTLRAFWLDTWGRELEAGWMGYMESQGPRWVAYLLAGGSLAAENQQQVAVPYPELEILPKDYSSDHILYRDLVEFLLGGDYRWGI